MMLKLFKKTPTVEEFREIVFKSLKMNHIQMPKDAFLENEYINGFEYSQFWKSNEQKRIYIARCADVRKLNAEIKFMSMGLS